MIDVSKPNFKKIVRKERPVIGQLTLYKKKEMEPKDAWGIIIKTIDDETGQVDENAAALFVPMRELKDLLDGRYWNASAYLFEGKKTQ